jgi:hypothetical protein
MADIRRLVLDILKPHEPSITEFAQKLETVEGVEGVNVTLIEIDMEVQNLKATLEGENIDDEKVSAVVEELGGSIHSTDEIVCGSKMVEKTQTPQDR